jgi:hypothetical protein
MTYKHPYWYNWRTMYLYLYCSFSSGTNSSNNHADDP